MLVRINVHISMHGQRHIETSVFVCAAEGSLLHYVDHCVTAFGHRKMRDWLCSPLLTVYHIEQRQDAVAALMQVGKARVLRWTRDKVMMSDRNYLSCTDYVQL